MMALEKTCICPGDSEAPPYPTGLDALLAGDFSKLVKVFLNSQVKNLERPI